MGRERRLVPSFIGACLFGTQCTHIPLHCQSHAHPPLQASPYTAGGRTISFEHPCDYFTTGKAKASTLSLSVLVAIEML